MKVQDWRLDLCCDHINKTNISTENEICSVHKALPLDLCGRFVFRCESGNVKSKGGLVKFLSRASLFGEGSEAGFEGEKRGSEVSFEEHVEVEERLKNEEDKSGVKAAMIGVVLLLL